MLTSGYYCLACVRQLCLWTRGLSSTTCNARLRYDSIPQANRLEIWEGVLATPQYHPNRVFPISDQMDLKLPFNGSCASVSGYMSVSTDPCTHTIPRIAVSAPHILTGNTGALPRSHSKSLAPITSRVNPPTRRSRLYLSPVRAQDSHYASV